MRWAIKLMNGRLMDFIAGVRRKTKDAHQGFFFPVVFGVSGVVGSYF